MNSFQPEDKAYSSGSEVEDNSNASGVTNIDQTESQLEHVSWNNFLINKYFHYLSITGR